MSSTLELNCLVFSDDINRIFSVEILRTESVGALKKAIKNKNKDTFQHVDADTLALWKVSFPVTTSLPEDLGNHEFVDKESLSPVEELSAVFSEPPILKYLHIVVKAPPTDPPSSTLQLVCYVRGDDYMRTFEVKIEMGEPVAAFRNAIKEKWRPDFDHVDADSLGLWNVNIPLDENLKETVDKLGLVDENLLFPLLLLSDVFPQQPADGHLHIVVKNLPISEC
ncbi:hypothetical protein M378DRAFT_86543 [Amanita muscaria Koide BX008]|uniref:Crinkler effector protein N-terminal domain-containing protein n=1 Tax=Amanita muscaria (strain Koide BX008) TaxID=946122 RepID=A0A0C2WNV3_AMAMK|nr:hypothetical protein M378DRAFT_86543 [Amanita muscaria Koide BX008]